MPVEPTTLGAFIIAVTAIVMSPGPDTLLILRYTLSSGQRVGLAAIAGVQLGLLAHTALAIGGISLIIASSPTLFRAVAIAGALYLAWLGLQGFREDGALSLKGGKPAVSTGKALRDAALCNLLNPKVILLFLALIPNFIKMENDNVPAQLVILAVTLILINIAWQAPIAWAADAVRRWLQEPSINRAVSRITGGILLLFAALMLYDNLQP